MLMRKLTRAAIPVAMTAALGFVLAPSTVRAQEQEMAESQATCTAQIDPATIQAGQKAVQVKVKLSEKVGNIESIEAGESGIALASMADLPKADMARADEDAAPKVIEMAADGTTATLWLNTEQAKTGAQHIGLKGEQGSCTAQVTIEAAEASGQ
jgi:hypothetical protein